MPHVSGMIYQDGDFFEGHVEFDEDGDLHVGSGFKDGAISKGIILPRLVNCHTHLGDAAIPKPEQGTIEEIVGPPDGYKHRQLRQIPEEEHVGAMHSTMIRMARNGISRFIDFREGGLEGVSRLLNSAVGTGIDPIILGRPENLNYEKKEIDGLLEVADGIGLSAISDWNIDDLSKIARETAIADKTFALHASERVREDIDEILSLKPRFLVHMVKADSEDLALCADEDIPIVICPRANMFFNIRPPVEMMMKADIKICLGTDNAMLAEPDLFAEMKALRGLVSSDVVSNQDILRILFENSRKVLNSFRGLGVEHLGDDGFMVLARSLDNPFVQVLGASKEDICYIWSGGLK